MNKKLYIGLAALVVVVAVVVGIGVASSGKKDTGMNMPMSSAPANPVATSNVTIQNYMFSPAAIKIKAGTTVKWTNTDNVTHTVSSDDGSAEQFEKENMPVGATFSHTFKKVGTFTYHCDIHPYMHGTVEVTNS